MMQVSVGQEMGHDECKQRNPRNVGVLHFGSDECVCTTDTYALAKARPVQRGCRPAGRPIIIPFCVDCVRVFVLGF